VVWHFFGRREFGSAQTDTHLGQYLKVNITTQHSSTTMADKKTSSSRNRDARKEDIHHDRRVGGSGVFLGTRRSQQKNQCTFDDFHLPSEFSR